VRYYPPAGNNRFQLVSIGAGAELVCSLAERNEWRKVRDRDSTHNEQSQDSDLEPRVVFHELCAPKNNAEEYRKS
jgi:hypothetical protein